VARLLADPRLRVRVAGHADASGSRASNLDLSKQRASAVLDYLVAAGVPADRVTAEAYGDTRPVAGNLTPRGRSLNRRVELVLQGT
jgi:outer membrane protein OmpA-like peptidoglycan-associated protein